MKETHDLHGKPRFNTTIDFKFALLEHLLASFPFIKSVQLLDDRKQHIELFTKFLGNYVTDSTDTTTSAVTPSSSASSSASLPPLPRLNSFQVQLVLHPHHQAKYIQSESLERELVFSLIEKCNKRILDAREREQRSSSVDSLASEGSFQIIDGDEVSSLAASDDDEYGDEGDEDCCDGDNDHHHLLHTSTITPSKSFSLSSSSTTSPTMSVCSSTQSPPLEAGGSISTSVDAETFTRRSINSVTATKPRYHRHTKSSVTSVSSNLNPINTMKTTLSHDALQKQLQQQAHLQIPASVKKLDVTNQQQQQQQQRQRQSSKLRRKSVSLFKTLIELEEEVNRTCVRLDQESTALLISRFQSLLPNNEWTLLSQELVICFGEACPNFIAKLGGLGSRLELQVVSYANGVGDVDVIAVSVDQARCVTGGGTEESHVVRFNSEEIHQTSSIKLQSPTILANTTTNESHIPPMTESPLSVLTEDEGGGVGGGGPAEGLNLEDDPMVGGGNTILLVPVQLQPQHQQPLPREKSLRSSIVKSMSSGQLPWGGSGLPHIVVAISPKARQRDAAKIKQNEWISLHPQPLLVQGTLTTVTKVGLKNGKRVRKEAALAKQQRRDVRIGFLVVKHHPQLVGRQIAIAVRHVENWMSKTFMDNIERNRPFIEAFVCEMNCGQVLLAAQEQEEKGVMSPLKVGQSFFDGLNQIMNK